MSRKNAGCVILSRYSLIVSPDTPEKRKRVPRSRVPRETRFLFSLFEYESSCHVSTAQKSEIFIISTFPAGRPVRSLSGSRQVSLGKKDLELVSPFVRQGPA